MGVAILATLDFPSAYSASLPAFYEIYVWRKHEAPHWVLHLYASAVQFTTCEGGVN